MQELSINPLFQPDSLAPAQFEETMHRSLPLEPEKRLMLAVLEDAVMCFQDNLFARDKKKKQLFLEAKDWLFEERSDRLFAFETLCHALNLNTYYFRRGLRAWQEARVRETNMPSKSQRPVKREAVASHSNGKRKAKTPPSRKRYHSHVSHRRNVTHASLPRI
jgi:hypothetical protein